MSKFVELTAIGSGRYILYMDAIEQSRHNAEREAVERSFDLLLDFPDAIVHYVHDYKVTAVLTNQGVTLANQYAQPTNLPPTVDSLPNPSFDEGTAAQYDMSQHTSDPDGDPLTHTIQGILPNGLSFVDPMLIYDGTGPGTFSNNHTLTVSDGSLQAVSAVFSINIAGTGFDWTHNLGALRLSPPTLVTPTVYNTLADMEPFRTFKRGSSVLGDHEYYQLGPATGAQTTEDILVDFRGNSEVMDIPIHFGRVRNIQVVGLTSVLLEQDTAWLENSSTGMGAHSNALGNEQYTLTTRDASGSGKINNVGLSDGKAYGFFPGLKLHQVTGHVHFGNPGAYSASFDNARLPFLGWNTKPSVAGGMLFRCTNSHMFWVEGCDLDLVGQNGDVTVFSKNGMTDAQNLTNSKMRYQNSRIVNWEGHKQHDDYGDRIHADLWQSQGGSRRHSFGIENCYVESGNEGQVVTGGAGPFSHTFGRNFQYINLPNLTGFINVSGASDPTEGSGGPVLSNPNATLAQEGPIGSGGWEIENLWIVNKTGNIVNLNAGAKITTGNHAEVQVGFSPIDFAPKNRIGQFYVSPH